MTSQIKRYGWYGIVGLSFMWLMYLSWFRWGHCIIDTFRDQWIFSKLAEGKVLYKDLFYAYGLLPPYVGAFLYKLFGTNITWSIYMGIGITIVTTIFLYRCARIFLNRVFTTVLIVNFLFVFAFSAHPIFNFILPYSIASTLFIMFVVSSLYFFLCFLRREEERFLLWWAFMSYFSFLSRIDYSCFVWLTYCLVGIFFLTIEKRQRYIICLLSPLVLAILSYAIFLFVNNAFEGFKESFTLFSFVGLGKNYFSFQTAGITNVFRNVMISGVSFFALMAVLSFFYFLSVGLSKIRNTYPTRSVSSLASCLIIIGMVMLGKVTALSIRYWYYRAVSIVLIVGVALYACNVFFHKDSNRNENSIRLMIFSVGLILILPVILKSSPYGYGFFLLVPALPCFYFFCIETWPSLLGKIIPLERQARRSYCFFLLVFFIITAVPFIQNNYTSYKRRNVELHFGTRGKMYGQMNPLTMRFQETINYLKDTTASNDTVVVFPEGIGINFLLPRENPLRYLSFIPNLVAHFGEEEIIQQLQRHDIDYIVIVNRPTFEYGHPFFGIHYGKKIARWVVNNYSLEKVIGPFPFTSREFGVAIYKKKYNDGITAAGALSQ